MSLKVGRVTGTRKARIHMGTHIAACGAANSAPITRPVDGYRGINLTDLCQRCFTPANLDWAQRETTTGTRFNAALDEFLCTVRRAVGYTDTPAGTAPKSTTTRFKPMPDWDTPALPATAPTTPPAPARSWGQLATAFGVHHSRRPVAADHRQAA